MRLITWNCKGGFRRKHPRVAELFPDVLVVPECDRLTAVEQVLGAPQVRAWDWVGENRRKGLGVVSYGAYALRRHPAYDPTLRWILPLDVTGPLPFTLLAVWAIPDPQDGTYVRVLFRALSVYAELFKGGRVIVAGDFNQSTAFDRPGSPLAFGRWVASAAVLGLRSLYHLSRGCEHGCEPEKTFFCITSGPKAITSTLCSPRRTSAKGSPGLRWGSMGPGQD